MVDSPIVKAFANLRSSLKREFEPPAPIVAYHYARTDVIRQILAAKKLHLADLAFLNDPSEFAFGHDLAANELRKLAAAMDPDPSLHFISIADQFEHASEREYLVMAASLCRSGDDLALWRPYGDDGSGCCVGIDLAKCRRAVHLRGASVTEVTYSDAIQRARLRRLLTAHIDLFNDLQTSANRREVMREMAVSVLAEVSWNSTSWKHSSYEAEGEWRLLQILERDDPHIEYRVNGAGWLVPYYEADVRSAIVKVVLGPRHLEGAVHVWRTWLDRNDLKEVTVERSVAPYR